MDNTNERTFIKIGCPGIFGVLLIIFVIAKIFEIGEIASWSWWIVLLPLWGPFAIFFGVLAIIAIGLGAFYLGLYIYNKIKKNKFN